MGFIFYEKSARYAQQWPIQNLDFVPPSIKKIGVFVNESVENILDIVRQYHLDGVQLHGNENPEMCGYLKAKKMLCIKSFGIAHPDDFAAANGYEPHTDYFLFDTKTPAHGGSGQKFDWGILQSYRGTKPFFLSGGIAPDDAADILQIQHPCLFGVDINSGFETAPAIKNAAQIRQFISTLYPDNPNLK
ncbi:N-(5'-phosphoribosyl)anthranilate isomerase [Bacteroidia bacterium]|nr:N-(5'-phosphoribosyl)anthranilate isomerase [Bacteroidia bacterium]